MDFLTLAILGAIATLAGFIDAIAGGGGLLTLPALLLSGLDPASALATNKLQSTFGSSTATWQFWRKGHLNIKEARPMVLSTFIGSVLGTLAVSFVSQDVLRAALPILLIAIAVYFTFSGGLKESDVHPRIGVGAFTLTAALGIGFYDGIFGPGTGSFFMLAFVFLLGFGILKATAHTKLLNFTSNAASLLVFLWAGHVYFLVGLVMGIGQLVGAWLGAHTAMRFGTKLIKPLLTAVCIIMAAKILFDSTSPWKIYLNTLFY